MLEYVAAIRTHYEQIVTRELESRPSGCPKKCTRKSVKMLSPSLRCSTAVFVEENLPRHAACAAWKKAVDEKLLQKVARDEMTNPEAGKIQERYDDASGGKPVDSREGIDYDAA